VRIKENGEIGFEENKIEIVACQQCNSRRYFEGKLIRELRLGHTIVFDCECGKKNHLRVGLGFVDEEQQL
jgi:hypothetical protein